MLAAYTRLSYWLRGRIPEGDDGDVPGWVMVTMMTAGLVTLLWAIAGKQLGDLFTKALGSVKGP